MNSAYLTTVSSLILEAALGAILLTITKFLRQPDPKKYREVWLKFAVLCAIITTFLGAGLIGVWGVVPVLLLLAYLAWQELLHGLPQQSDVVFPTMLSVVGSLAVLSGFGNSSDEFLFAMTIFAWSAILVPMLVLGRPIAMIQTFAIAFGMVSIGLPLALLLRLGLTVPSAFIFISVLVMANDGFSEVSGRLLGQTPLCPDISPNKTLEGALGGIIFSCGTAYLLKSLLPDWQTWEVLTGAAVISVLSLIGDLLFSSLKRQMGIKDFSRVLAVTGGVLDKFDGLLFSVPIFYIMFHFNQGL